MLQGTLDEFPLIDVLGILKARNKTGRLDIERQAGRGLIYVRLGEPYYAESSLTRSLIGQKLVDIGAITDMQLRKALDRQAESGDRLGEILLTHGVISREHIASAVISQIKDALADLLAWETGEFKWEIGAEVEVEVPVYGGMLDADGSGPLAPHVVPVTVTEPAAAPSIAQPVQGQALAQPDFSHSGATLHASAATAPQIDEAPRFEPQVQPQLEVVHSPAVGGGSTDEESPPVPFDQAAAEPELHTAVENETEQHEASEAVDENPNDDGPDEIDGSESAEDWSYQGHEPTADDSFVDDSFEDDSFEDEPSQEGSVEDEPLSEESVDEPVAEEPVEHEFREDEPAEQESYESESDEFGEDELADEPVEDEPVEDELVEIVESHNGTRVIKSRPAPEFDEEFDRMFASADKAAESVTDEAPFFEAEPVVEAPLDEAPSFEAEPVVEALDEAPIFEPAEHQPGASFGFAPVEQAPIAEVPEVPEAPVPPAPEPVVVNPPPPPPTTPPPHAPVAQVTEAPEDEPNAPDEEQAPQEPAVDIKLDRSSLVRELSDLLR